MATEICERCGLRPAVATIRRVRPGVGEVTQRLCEVCLEEVRGGSSAFGGRGLFDDFFSDFFDRGFPGTGQTGGDGGDGGAATSVPTRRRGVDQVDVTEYFSDATRELLQRAAQNALERGSMDLDN